MSTNNGVDRLSVAMYCPSELYPVSNILLSHVRLISAMMKL